MTAELTNEGDDVEALWRCRKETDLQITEWRGTSAFVLAPTGPAAADYIQIALGRESEWQAAPIVNPDYRPFGEEELFDPSWIRRDELAEADPPGGPRLSAAGSDRRRPVHLRSFLGRCDRIERERREAKRPELERRVIQEIGPGGTREIPFLEAAPDWFEHVPRELRLFGDWEQSSADAHRVVAHWALDIGTIPIKASPKLGSFRFCRLHTPPSTS